MKGRSLGVLAATFVLLVAAAPARAHHSFAAVFDANQPVTVWVRRDNTRQKFVVVPEQEKRSGMGLAGWEQEANQVAAVSPGMPASEVGLRQGDFINSRSLQQCEELLLPLHVFCLFPLLPKHVIIKRNSNRER